MIREEERIKFRSLRRLLLLNLLRRTSFQTGPVHYKLDSRDGYLPMDLAEDATASIQSRAISIATIEKAAPGTKPPIAVQNHWR